jgi:transposase InsO family protein
VKLYLEEGFPAELVASELGIGKGCIFDWTRQYREGGEAGLRPKPTGHRPLNTPKAVAEKILALKRENPGHGPKRLSQILRRFFFLKASPKQVRKHLKRTALVLPKAKARKSPEPPERRFERSTPNQMWQSDITYFSVLGKTAYIIGFIDDYSRYITGLGVYRSHTGEFVLETYRSAVAAYGVPKEMLTDNGRQYATWRGKTKFQKELEKDHVHHIRSAPHHPMTLGKIERFWQSLKEEFLERARFETFEEARERIACWVKYYNHKRTHQGLDGMCPADRFFSIQKELKETIERGVAANIEELALRGKPVQPFYMVGRVGDKSVVIETDKKRMSVLVDGRELSSGQGMTYEIEEGVAHETGTGDSGTAPETADESVQREGEEPGGALSVERAAERRQSDEGTGRGVGGSEQLGEAGAHGDAHGTGPDVEAAGDGVAQTAQPGGKTDGTDTESGTGACGVELTGKETHHEDNGTGPVRGGGQVSGSVDGVDGTEESVRSVPRHGGERLAVLPVAGSGSLGYVGGVGAAGNEGRRGGPGVAGTGQAPAGSEGPGAGSAEPGTECRLAQPSGEEPGHTGNTPDRRGLLIKEVRGLGAGSESGREDAGDPGSPGREAHGHAGGVGPGGEPQDVLRVAGARQGGDALGVDRPAGRPASESGRPGEGSTAGRVGNPGEGPAGTGRPAPDPGSDPADVRGTAERDAAA